MSLTSSPQHNIQTLLRRRTAVIIPKDQQQILDNDDSWTVGRHPPNVPGHVLETVVQAYMSRQNPSYTKKTHSLSGHSQRRIEEKELAGEESPPPTSPIPADGSLISWETTPERDLQSRSPVLPIQSQVVHETPRAEVSHNHGASALHHHPRLGAHMETIEDEKEDNDDVESDLEVELPEAHEMSNAPVNRDSAHLAVASSTPAIVIASQALECDTPPCAQPNQQVIPGTVVADHIVTHHETKLEGKRRRMKPIVFEDDLIEPVHLSTSYTRMPKMTLLSEVDSSNSTSSSSLIPATCASAPTQQGITAVAPTRQHTEDEQKDPHAKPGPSTRPVDNHKTHVPSETTVQAESKQTSHTSLPRRSDIYQLFTSTYPDYELTHSGRLEDFISACVYLQYLEPKRKLREYLYDDFIRCFSSGYRPYVSEAAREAQQPLFAIEWFNMLPGEPEFHKMVISKQNLASVLTSYPNEVVKVGRVLSRGSKDMPDSKRQKREEEPQCQQPVPDHAMDVDTPNIDTPAVSPPGTAIPRRAAPLSPQLDSDAPVPPTATPSSSAVRLEPPRASQYFERLASESKSPRSRILSAEKEAQMRKHFQNLRKRKASAALSSGSPS